MILAEFKILKCIKMRLKIFFLIKKVILIMSLFFNVVTYFEKEFIFEEKKLWP